MRANCRSRAGSRVTRVLMYHHLAKGKRSLESRCKENVVLQVDVSSNMVNVVLQVDVSSNMVK
uniref:Uncharacterized protein n=2 Tax=Arundo donax TaxID=35708 RepID=A0A0A9CHD7_ARUDO